MRRNLPLALFLIAAAFVSAGFAAGKSLGLYLHFLPYYFSGPPPDYECGAGSMEAKSFRYCVFHAPYGTLEDPDSVVYFLHYGSGDEKSWRNIPISRVFYAEFRKRGLRAPRVVSISYGPYWSLFDKGGGRLASPIMPDFLDHAMPWLEKKIGTPKRRYVWGMSQGGLNGALLLFKNPKLWSGAVLACPALLDFDIYGPKEEIAAYARSRGLALDRLQYGMNMILDRMADAQEWKREDPLARAAGFPARARHGATPSLPPVFIDCDRKDELGYYGGGRKFADILRARGVKVGFQEEPGTHCAVDPWGPSRFIADLEAKG